MNCVRGRSFLKIVVIISFVILILAFLERKVRLNLKGQILNDEDLKVVENSKISVSYNKGVGETNIGFYDAIMEEAILNVTKLNNIQLNYGQGNKNVKLLKNRLTSSDTSWKEYRNDWGGEKLISINGNEIIFSKKYRQQMEKKGYHLLLQKNPVFKERNKNIEKYCDFWGNKRNISDSIDISGRRLLFVDKFELLACNIPKASSTTITQVLMRMDQGLSSDEQPKGPVGAYVNISVSNNLENDFYMIAKRIQTYTKMIVTRHPFSLIGSKYHFKVANTAEDRFQREECPEIIKKLYLKGLPTDEEVFIRNKKEYAYLSEVEFKEKLFQFRRLKAGPGKYNITLLEYIKTILNKRTEAGDELLPSGQTLTCNPCAVRYDVILHYSNVHEEVNNVLDFIQRDIPYEKRVHYPEHSPLMSWKRCNDEFSGIPMEFRKRLYEYFKLDFLLFGYHFERNPDSKNACY